jgi:hypothetical protein
MSEPYLIHGTIKVICKCGVKSERGRKLVLMKKYPEKCPTCGQKRLINFEESDTGEDDD